MGTVFVRGASFQIQYYRAGKKFRETVRSTRREDAIRLLKQREGEIARGRPLFTHADKITFEVLAKDFITDYEVNGKRSVGKARKTVKKLTEFFGGWKVANITTPAIRTYIEHRQRDGFSNGTINRDLAALKRMFSLAVKASLLSHDHKPDIPMLKEASPRAGFFEPEQFQAVLPYLRLEIKPVALFAYETGWRLREILRLERRQVDLTEGSVRLDPGTTKNGEGRVAYCSPELLAVLRAQQTATRELERENGIIIPWVFHRKGRRILRFLASWQTACRLAGIPGMLFHDLRRTAVRNMVRAGIPERVAMQISGHKTRSVFERYNIVSEGDLREAAKRLAAHTNGRAGSLPSGGGPAATGSIHEGR